MNTKLATTASVTSTYSGEFAGEYIKAALLAAPTLANQTVTFKTNIPYKTIVKKVGALGTIVTAASCDFSDTGSISLTERVLTPANLKVNMQLCKLDYIADYESPAMGPSAWKSMPPKFSDFIIGAVAEQVASETETTIWQYSAQVSGVTVLAKADSDVVDIQKVTGLTSATIGAELSKMAIAISALNKSDNHVIYIAKDLAMLYLISLGGFASFGANGYKNEGPQGLGGIGQLSYAGIPLVITPGMPAGEMLAADPANIWVGTALLSDFNKVAVIDQEDIDGSDNINLVMKYSLGVQYGEGKEIIYFN